MAKAQMVANPGIQLVDDPAKLVRFHAGNGNGGMEEWRNGGMGMELAGMMMNDEDSLHSLHSWIMFPHSPRLAPMTYEIPQ